MPDDYQSPPDIDTLNYYLIMHSSRKHFLILSCCILSLSNFVLAQDKIIDFTSKWDTTRVLKNPFKGWYHHLLDNGINKYAIKDENLFLSFPGMDHLYLRLAWNYLEPLEGKFNWTDIDRVVEKYVPKGYKISFRISCSETGSFPDNFGELIDGVHYATPSWVRNAGAEGTIVDNGRIRFWVPKWDDPVYLEKLDQFHKAFAARYDDKSWVSYVDIGSIGDWGEGHTSFSTKITPTMSEVKANIDVYLKNYKKSQIVANDDMLSEGRSEKDNRELYQYVVSKGISLRDDSPLVDWYFQHCLKDSTGYQWTVSHPRFYDPLYLTKPIVLEMQHYRSIKKDENWLGENGETMIPKYKVSGAETLRGALEIMHATYIGYHGYAEDWLADNPDLTRELANRCGYWYFPVKAILPGKFLREKASLSIEWLNKGVAPAYKNFSLSLRFEADKPENSFELLIENSGNMNWMPGENLIEKYVFDIPLKTPRGNYKLSFKLFDHTNEKQQDIQIGLSDKIIDNHGFVYLGTVSI